MIVNTLRYAVAVASALLGLVPAVPAAGEEMKTLCLEPVYSRERYVTIKMGYSKDVQPADFDTSGHKYAGWFEAVKDRFWQLNVPDDFVIDERRASDRAGVITSVTFDLLYPEMLPVVEVQEEMQQLGVAKFGPFENKAGLPGCKRRGPLGTADLGRNVTINLRAPSVCCRAPLDERRCTSFSQGETAELVEPHISGLRACWRRSNGSGDHIYGTLDDQPFALTCPSLGGVCVGAFGLWTWPVTVHFGKDHFDEWQDIVGAARAFLDSATQSKSDVPGDIK
jgi:hypothetical protein